MLVLAHFSEMIIIMIIVIIILIRTIIIMIIVIIILIRYPISCYVEEQFDKFLEAETRVDRKALVDTR